MTRPNLDAIEARALAATRGPWAWQRVSRDDNGWCIGVVDPPQTGEIVETYNEKKRKFNPLPEVVEYIAESGNEGTPSDAAFICAARDDVPVLVSYARRLEESVSNGDRLLRDASDDVARKDERIRELEARCARAAELFKAIQWNAIEPNLDPHCPSCEAAKYQRDDIENQYGPHKPDCKLAATLAMLTRGAAPTITNESALAEAKRRWPTGVTVGVGQMLEPREFAVWYQMKDDAPRISGTGPTWEAAFADADRRAK